MSKKSDMHKQRQAIKAITEGMTAIPAGAGTGKTSLIIEGISAVLASSRKGITTSSKILAVTFGKKAAKEIKQRLKDAIGDKANNVIASTLHSHAASIVRNNAKVLGFSKQFSIIGDDAVIRALKRICASQNLSLTEKQLDEEYDAIELFKAKGLFPNQIAPDSEYRLKQLYKELQETLMSANCLTYSDLILYACKAYEEQYEPDGQWEQIFVDETQDINPAQYAFIQYLAGKKANICMVGDDDQCIYGWRGADPKLMQRFTKDYSAKICSLEQNFRSTGCILKAANSVITNNSDRIQKELFTKRDNGQPIRVQRLSGLYDEACFIAKYIKKRLKEFQGSKKKS